MDMAIYHCTAYGFTRWLPSKTRDVVLVRMSPQSKLPVDTSVIKTRLTLLNAQQVALHLHVMISSEIYFMLELLPFHETPPAQSTNTMPPPTGLSTLFIDNVVKDLGLTHVHATKLHTLALSAPSRPRSTHLDIQLGSRVSPPLSEADLATRVYLLDSVLALIEETKAAVMARNDGTEDLPALLNDMQIWLNDTFKLSKEQNENIWCITYELMYHHSRLKFKTFHSEVESTLEACKNTLQMTNIYGNPVCEKILHMHVKKAALGIHSRFQAEIIDSVFNSEKKTTLEDFTRAVTVKYSPHSAIQLHASYLVRNALLRRFAIDNPQLMNIDEPAVDESSTSSTQAGSPPKKCKTTVGGRIPEGEDFWSKADAYINAYVKKWGKNLAAPEWQQFISQLVAADEQHFPHITEAWQLAPPTEPVNSQGSNIEVTNSFTSSAIPALLPPSRTNGYHLLNVLNPVGGQSGPGMY
ncbi:hypothetical protein V8D89_006325 [Ganoderma adspersum]